MENHQTSPNSQSKNQKKLRRPRKSLRSILIVLFILFAMVPIGLITGYSSVMFSGAIDLELQERFIGNKRELQITLEDYERDFRQVSESISEDKSIRYYIVNQKIDLLAQKTKSYLRNSGAHQISIYDGSGRLRTSVTWDSNIQPIRRRDLEDKDIFLSEKFLASTQDGDRVIADFTGRNVIDFVAFSKVESKGIVVGYVETVLRINSSFLENLGKRLGLEMVFVSNEGSARVASHDDLVRYKKGYFLAQYVEHKDSVTDLSIRGEPYGFNLQVLNWGESQFLVGLAASKKGVSEVVVKVSRVFWGVTAVIALFLVILSVIISRIVLRPLNELVETIEDMDFDEGPVEVTTSSNTEIGVLTDSFNELSQRVHKAQVDLKNKINQLESANQEIRDTQAQLVHAAKMSSLGKLVAGIAHELNNPIGFIYSNMTHLKDYEEKLVALVDEASKKTDLKKEKEKYEFDYIRKDLPQLINSCAEGAKRTRDIVVGLRNFSRLEEAKVKEVDLHEGIDNTLKLIDSEFRGRIEVVKKYAKVPKVVCYPSQLNQVFMNILTNAAQAIEGTGKIYITTKSKAGKVTVSIRDTGKGMSKDVRDKIFDPFYTTKDINVGTGLGMSITYGIIQKHGGEISVKSEIGKGTEFIIQLPVRPL